jgi:hypothetical protein
MKHLRFAALVMLPVVFASCPGEGNGAEIVYDNRSDFDVSYLRPDTEDYSRLTLAPGKTAAHPYEFINSYGSTVFEFAYTQNGNEFHYPENIEGPYIIRIRQGETKTVVIYNGYYEIR